MKILVLLWKLWFYILNLFTIILIAPPIIILSYFNNTFSFIYFLIRVWAYTGFYGMGMRLKKNFTDNLNSSEQYIIVSNHTSLMDVMLMIILHPKHALSFVGKKELEKIPLFGTAYKRVCVMVDRKSAKSKAEVYRRSIEKIKDGRSMIIFPEGGVSETREEQLLPFKDGAFRIAKKAEIPIVAYTFEGLKKAFPFKFWKGKPMKINVFRENIFSKEEIAERTEKAIKEETYSLILKRLNKKSN